MLPSRVLLNSGEKTERGGDEATAELFAAGFFLFLFAAAAQKQFFLAVICAEIVFLLAS